MAGDVCVHARTFVLRARVRPCAYVLILYVLVRTTACASISDVMVLLCHRGRGAF